MDFSKAAELIEKSGQLGILLPPEPDFDILASGEVLVRTLGERGKICGFIAHPPKEITQDAFPGLASAGLLPREFIVSLDTIRAPILQLRYEKKEEAVEIVLSPAKSPIKKEDVSFREGKTQCDALITLGVEDVEALSTSDTEPEIFSEKPIINIDISSRNKKYGEANLVEERAALSEIIYNFLLALDNKPPSSGSAQLLLSALVYKTGNFTSPLTSADTMLISSELMRLGAKLGEALTSKPLPLLQLLGRASVRSRLSENRGILWTFLTAEDFEKTGRKSSDAAPVLEYLEKAFPPHELTVLLSQEEKNGKVEATLAGGKPALEALASSAGGTFQSPYLKLDRSFENFREAEEKISALLQEVL